jgi:hypothetical protein
MVGCNKESDTNSPSITILAPVKGSVYSVYDTIRISAVIKDESKLESVKVTLLDQDQKPVLGSQVFKPTTSDYIVKSTLPINDIHLKGGRYSLQVKAYDGTNFTNAYSDIFINEIPLALKSILLVTRAGNYGTDISMLSEGGVWRKIIMVTGDYNTSDINSYDQVIYTAGALSGDLNAVALPEGNVAWQVPLLSSPPYRYFEDVLFSWPLLYVAYYDGYVYGYQHNGTVVYSTNTTLNYYPEKLGLVSNTLLAWLHSKTGNVSLLAAYYLASGSMMQSVNIPIDVIAFENEDNDNVLVFGNVEGTGKIMEYTLSQNNLRFLHDFPDGRIGNVARMDNQNFFITGDQAIHRYIRPTNTLVEYIPGTPSKTIDFDIVNQQLYAISNHNLIAFDVFTHSQVLNISVTDSVLALHLLYNK